MVDSTKTTSAFIALAIICVAVAGIFLVPLPSTTLRNVTVTEPVTTVETRLVDEPYAVTAWYTDQPDLTVAECRYDVAENPQDYLDRGVRDIDALLAGDEERLLRTCTDVIRHQVTTGKRGFVRFRTVERTAETTTLRNVTAVREERTYATLFMRWTGQA